MSTKLTDEDLIGLRAHYANAEKYADINALLDHCTALEEELKAAQGMVATIEKQTLSINAWRTKLVAAVRGCQRMTYERDSRESQAIDAVIQLISNL